MKVETDDEAHGRFKFDIRLQTPAVVWLNRGFGGMLILQVALISSIDGIENLKHATA